MVAGVKRGVTAALWPTAPGSCRVDLPALSGGSSAVAYAINGDGTIAGGSAAATAASVPLRWRLLEGGWQVEQLDSRSGVALASNGVGDLAGYVRVPVGTSGCVVQAGCQRAVVWEVNGGVMQLGTLGGADSWARGINADGEVVGASTSSNGVNTGYFWSPSFGMFQLPVKGQWGAANGISDVRADGTRLVVGMNSQGVPVAWMVRTP